MIPADLSLVQTRFPLDGFEPGGWTTHEAYQLFRRRVQAALREFLGVHEEQARLRAQEDDWTELFAAMKPLTKGRVGRSDLHPMTLQSIKTFGLVARSYGWQPRELTRHHAERIDADFSGNKRDANARALRRLDDLRAFPQLTALLPARPIGFTPGRRVAKCAVLDPIWERQFGPWIAAVTETGWDPVTRTFTDRHTKHAHVMRSAFRTTLRIGIEIGVMKADATDLRMLLADDEAICAIAREMFQRKDRDVSDGRLTARTSRKYLKAINQVRVHLDLDTTILSQVLSNNATAREGRRADQSMTAGNRAFCEQLVAHLHLRRRFLGSYRTLRAAAAEIIAGAAAESRELSGHERSRVRKLGAAACFAAIEIGGAPIRVRNAMQLTCIGDDANIRIPGKGNTPIQLLIPAGDTKNKVEIAFPIRANKFGYHDTIRWYLKTIRPLSPSADKSAYLFPSLRRPDRHLNPSAFGADFKALMRTVVDLPMTPHQMRHGQTSLLLNHHPQEVDVIAKRIDDLPDTLRRFYAFLDSMRLVERGQDLIVGLMHD